MIDNALPIALDLADPDLAADVAAHVESVLGWQVVRPGPHLPVRLRLADHVDPAVPTIVILRHDDATVVRGALRAGALDVVTWPTDAGRLADLRVDDSQDRPAEVLVAISAAACGVGASTVVLALGALAAWSGRGTVVVTDDRARRLAGVVAQGVQPVAGVDRLSVAADVHAAGVGGRPHVMLVDVGVGRRGHVLVARPDRALAQSLADRPATTAVVTVGEGGLRVGELRSVLQGRLHVAVPWSFRVGRAGVRGRVPVALPGAWVAQLRPILAAHVPAVVA
ncbi:MAG TPA: hypothetical protein VMM13_05365 [Euzebya sp.]|nr:hypothetical protein [Euzebya sp.]